MTLPEKSQVQIAEALKILEDVLENGSVRFTLKMRKDLERAETILYSLTHSCEISKH